MAIDAQLIYNANPGSIPATFTVPPGLDLIFQSVSAEWNGAGASGDFLACLSILSQSGVLIARAFPNTTFAPGDSGEVTYAPFLVDEAEAAAAAAQCTLLGSATGSGNTLTITLDSPVPADGVLHAIFCGTTPDHTDTAWSCTAAADSQAVAGWTVSTVTAPIIGLIRQTNNTGGVDRTTQCGGVGRACTAADLGAGDTVTLTFNSAFAASFKTAGLLVWQNSYFVAVKNGGIIEYGFGDSYDDFSANASRLSWLDDFGVGMGAPEFDARVITAMGASPGQTGFAPIEGSLVGEVASADVSIAAHCFCASKLTRPDPGGDWPSAATQLVGNYQTVQPRVCS